MTCLRLTACLAVLGGATAAGLPQDPQFRAATDLVSVYATVVDRDGRLVTNLTAGDFEVFDNGARQRITVFAADPAPVTLVIMLDRSGSVAPNHDLVREAAEELVANLRPDDRVRLGSFSREVQLDPETFTSDRDELIGILRDRLQEGGPTPLWQATGAAIDALAHEAGRRVVVLFSDGDDSPSFSQPDVAFADVRVRARQEDVMVYAIGLSNPCDDAPAASLDSDLRFQRRGGRPPVGSRPRFPRPPARPGIIILPPGGRFPPALPPDRSTWSSPCRPTAPDPSLRTLAADGGGGYFVLSRAADLSGTFARVAEELHHQYLLAFPAPARDGKVHTLRVRVGRAGTMVRARASYLAPAR